MARVMSGSASSMNVTRRARPALAAAALALLPLAAGAASLSLSMQPPSVEVGEAATLTISLTNGESLGNPQFTLPPDAQMTGGPSTSQMHRISGGRSTKTLQYQYRVVFSKAGNYTLGPATIRTRQGVLKSGRAAVAVRKAGKLGGVAVVATIEPTRVYVGQAVVATYVFGISRNIQGYELAVPFLEEKQGLRVFDAENLAERWDEAAARTRRGLSGYTVLDVATPRVRVVAKEESRRIPEGAAGVPYQAYIIRRVIVPQEPGRYDFGAARAGATVGVGHSRPRGRAGRDPFVDDPFADLFGRSRGATKTVFAASEPLTLEVLPPPEDGRPPGFDGAVGRFEMTASVTPSETTLGGAPFELTLTVRGEGNIETVGIPRLPESPDFRVGVAEQKQEYSFRDGKLRGEKRFTVPLRPGSVRLKEIPRATLVAFDPFDEKYVTVATEPIPVNVTVPEDSGALESIGLPENVKADRRARDVEREDIEDIETDVDVAESHAARLHGSAGITAFGLLPACAYAALSVFAARWRRLRDDETLARRLSAARTARQKLDALREDLDSLGTAEFAEGLSRALQGYLADRLGRPAGEIPPGEAESLLAAAGLPEASAREVAAMLEEAETARFGGGEVDGEEWLARVESCVGSLERQGAA
jgi:hypothetical protein